MDCDMLPTPKSVAARDRRLSAEAKEIHTWKKVKNLTALAVN